MIEAWKTVMASMPDHVREDFEERAAIMEYCGNMDRDDAEREAFLCVMRRG